MIETRLLHYFLAIAREQSITRAAESLHVTQPTLSKQMMDLERQLGKQLLVRGKKKVTLTDEGAYLRSMEFASCTMTFSYDAQKQNPVLEMLCIDMDGLEGPRCVRIGDTLSSVISRFRNGEGDYDGVSREVLYGDGENAPYGLAEYGDDATAGLWYAAKLEDGRTVVLSMSFEQMYLSDITLYVDN